MFVQPLFFALKGIPGAVTSDGNISNQVIEVKMTVHIGFVKLCMAVTADGDISNQATEVKNNLAYRICRIVHCS